MKLKRNKIFYDVVGGLTNAYVGLRHDIVVEGLDVVPRDGPALILSKHQFYSDIPIECFVVDKYVGRKLNWVMKSTLPPVLDYGGAVRVRQKKKIISGLFGFARSRKSLEKSFLRIMGKDGVFERDDFDWEDFKDCDPDSFYIDSSRAQNVIGNALMYLNIAEGEFNKFNENATEYIGYLYKNDNILVLHPEGTRNIGKMGNIDMPLVEHARGIQEKCGKEIPLILMGMNYNDKGAWGL